MEKIYKQCQSCGMPLNKDKKGGGSEKDGTLSKKYCSSCYQNGEFKNPNMSIKEMQKLVDDILKNEIKFPKILRWLAVKQIPKLARWKK
ncbi:zinc ribbon domain-containing protein [Patescibacteria group bacterium]|nr:zinc ribbon domain-containing protein [Patescibacteria group bacterium]